MANTYITPYMSLTLPTVSVQLGPQWAQNIDDAFARVDFHNHTSGFGLQIPTAGLNINDGLNFNSNDAKTLRTSSYINNVATLPTSDLRAVYVASGNLYFNNGAGAPVQITSGTSINTGALALNIWSYQSVASSIAIASSSSVIYFNVNTSTIPVFINLPAANSVSAGRYIIIKDKTGNASVNPIYVLPAGSNSIEGITSFTETINQNYGSEMFISDGVSNWSTFKQGSTGATTTNAGTIKLAGDLAGTGSTFNTPRVVDASTTVAGKIQLAGDLIGNGSTSTNPTIGKLTGVGTSGAVLMGALPAQSGVALRLTAPGTAGIISGITVRNVANTVDIKVAGLSSTNNVELGDANAISQNRGGQRVQVRNVSGSAGIDSTGVKDYVLFCQASSLVTLPAGEVGRVLIIKDVSGGVANNSITPISIVPAGSVLIEGLNATKKLTGNYGSWTFIADVSGNWWMV